MEKIIPIVSAALSLLALVVGVLVLLQVMGVKTMLLEAADTEDAVAVDPYAIPITQLEEFTMDQQFVLTLDNLDTGNKANVVFKLGFAIDTLDEDAESARTALTSQGSIIQDRIAGLLSNRDLSYYKDPEKMAELKTELLTKVQELIGNRAVVDVYFKNLLISEQ